MKKQQQRVPTVRLRNSYVTTVVSISMVLFLLSLLGLLILNARQIGDYVKENIGFSVILKDNVREADRVQLMKYFDASPAIKSTTYISAEQAAEELQKELGKASQKFYMHKFQHLHTLTPWKQKFMLDVLDIFINHSYLAGEMRSAMKDGKEMPDEVKALMKTVKAHAHGKHHMDNHPTIAPIP